MVEITCNQDMMYQHVLVLLMVVNYMNLSRMMAKFI
jgi:hypothetical protein